MALFIFSNEKKITKYSDIPFLSTPEPLREFFKIYFMILRYFSWFMIPLITDNDSSLMGCLLRFSKIYVYIP